MRPILLGANAVRARPAPGGGGGAVLWDDTKLTAGTSVTGSGLIANVSQGDVVLANCGKSAGKWEWEIECTVKPWNYAQCGVMTDDGSRTAGIVSPGRWYCTNGTSGPSGGYPAVWDVGDRIRVKLDFDYLGSGSSIVEWLKNGVYSDQRAVTAGLTYFPAVSEQWGDASVFSFRGYFDPADWETSPTPGYSPLSF